MPSTAQREALAENISTMAAFHLQTDNQHAVARLRQHANSLLWHLDCAAVASIKPLRVVDLVPGFGLLFFKSGNWIAVEPDGEPEPMDIDAQRAFTGVLQSLAERILPADGSGKCHSYQTDDGLICVLYRIEDEQAIMKATGLESSVPEPTRLLH
jgi:hypothetical protein